MYLVFKNTLLNIFISVSNSKESYLSQYICNRYNISTQFMNKQDKVESKIIKQTQIYRGKWLGMKYVDYTIGKETLNSYEKVFRTTTKPGQIDGVDIIPIIKYKNKKAQLLMNVQFRPPINGFTLQFPTGMTNDTNYQQNAKRQLLEETGYTIESFCKIPLPKTYYDPWKSDQTSYIFIANIDGDSPNSFSKQQLEEDENIKNVKFDIDEHLVDKIATYSKEHNLHVQAKVFSLSVGIWLRNNLQSL